MNRWIVLITLAACGDPTTPETSTPSTPSTPTGETATTPTDTGWECNPWYPCQECGGVSCGAEIGTCAGDGACGAALNAWAACVLDCGNPPTCAATFAADGGSAAGALLGCVEAACAKTCGL